jgi:NAD(P)-dependent dehydrogenase (short-subunit alcohol dehydrogenase family)
MHRPITLRALCPGYVETTIVRNQLPGLMRRFDVDETGARDLSASANRHKKLLDVDEVTTAALWLLFRWDRKR